MFDCHTKFGAKVLQADKPQKAHCDVLCYCIELAGHVSAHCTKGNAFLACALAVQKDIAVNRMIIRFLNNFNCNEILYLTLDKLRVKVVSNSADALPRCYFSKLISEKYSVSPNITIFGIDTEFEKMPESIIRLSRQSYRAQKLQEGYHLGHHFGNKFCMYKESNNYYFFGKGFGRLFTKYIVKFILTTYALQSDLLHLKGTAITVGEKGVLIVGRGGAGKTTFMTQMCNLGAKLISNTHCLICGNEVRGIYSNIRLRNRNLIPNTFCNSVFQNIGNDIYVDPADYLGSENLVRSAKLSTIIALTRTKSQSLQIREMEFDEAYYFLKTFSWAVLAYAMTEDIADYVGDDTQRHSSIYATTKNQLDKLISQVKCYYLNVDILDYRNQTSVYNMLLEGACEQFR